MDPVLNYLDLIFAILSFILSMLAYTETVKGNKLVRIIFALVIGIAIFISYKFIRYCYINNMFIFNEPINESASSTIDDDLINNSENTNNQYEIATITPTTEKQKTILLYDDFSDNDNNWIIQGGDIINSYISDGEYIHKVSCPMDYDDYFCLFFIPIPDVIVKDFEVEFDATITKTSNNPNVIIAIFARNNENGYYYLGFRNYGNYSFIVNHAGSNYELVSREELVLYNKLNNVSNTLGLIVDDCYFYPKINGEIICPKASNIDNCYIEDISNNCEGTIDLVLLISRGESAIITIDNVLVSE